MAELPYSGARQSSSAAYSLGTLTNYAGAVVSLGLMVGIGVWGYKVVARDVSGVPVVCVRRRMSRCAWRLRSRVGSWLRIKGCL